MSEILKLQQELEEAEKKILFLESYLGHVIFRTAFIIDYSQGQLESQGASKEGIEHTRRHFFLLVSPFFDLLSGTQLYSTKEHRPMMEKLFDKRKYDCHCPYCLGNDMCKKFEAMGKRATHE